MAITGIERIVIGVGNLDESLAFYRDEVGMQVIAEETLDPENINMLWDLPRGIQARAALLRNAVQSTLLELVEFSPRIGKSIRGETQPWDYGIYDIGLLVNDLDEVYKDLTAKGGKFLSPPFAYSPAWVPYDVKENIMIGPDKMPIALIELVNLEPPLTQRFGRIVDSAQCVENMEEVIRFYRDLLGLQLQCDMHIPRGLIDDVLILPKGTDIRFALFNQEGSEGPFVECLEYSCPGISLASIAKPPNLGIFMIAFETDDLPRLIEKITEENLKIMSGPIEMELAPYGVIKTIIVEGPSKVMIELFERQ